MVIQSTDIIWHIGAFSVLQTNVLKKYGHSTHCTSCSQISAYFEGEILISEVASLHSMNYFEAYFWDGLLNLCPN